MTRKARILDRRYIPAGQLVMEQGNVGNRAFIIESGRVEIFMKDSKDRTVHIGEAGPGEIIGEMAIINGGQRSASIRTLENCVMIVVSAQDLTETMGQPGGLFMHVLKLMAERLEETNTRLLRQHSDFAEIGAVAEQLKGKPELKPVLDRLKDTLDKYGGT